MFLIVILFCLNTNAIGANKTIEKSTITRFVTEKSSELLSNKDKDLVNKIVFNVFSGDVLKKTDEKTISSFVYVEENVIANITERKYIESLENDVLSDEQVRELIKTRVDDLYHLSVVVKSLEKELPGLGEKFEVLAEDVLKVSNKQFKDRSLDKIEYNANELGIIMIDLKETGLDEKVLDLLREITVGK